MEKGLFPEVEMPLYGYGAWKAGNASVLLKSPDIRIGFTGLASPQTGKGLFLGMSCGAAVAVALRLARDLERGLIVAIAPDGGERYLSTPLYAEKEIPTFQVYNSLTRAKEAFEPYRPGEASLFVDGPALNSFLSLGAVPQGAVHL